jgi:hypothetical protein
MHADLIVTQPPPLPGPLLYDALDLLRQTLCNLFEDARHIHAAAYNEFMLGNSTRSSQDVLHSLRGLGGLHHRRSSADLDTLLATNPNFLLGTWTTTARAWAGSAAEAVAAAVQRAQPDHAVGRSRARSTTTPPSSGRRSSPTTTTSAGPCLSPPSSSPWRRACRSTPPRSTTPCSIATCSGTTANNDTVYPTTTTGDQAASVSATLHGALRPDARQRTAFCRAGRAPMPRRPSQRLYHACRRSRATCRRWRTSVLADPLCGGFTTEGYPDWCKRRADHTDERQRRDDVCSQLKLKQKKRLK